MAKQNSLGIEPILPYAEYIGQDGMDPQNIRDIPVLQKFRQLLNYKTTNGHIELPNSPDGLGAWLHRQFLPAYRAWKENKPLKKTMMKMTPARVATYELLLEGEDQPHEYLWKGTPYAHLIGQKGMCPNNKHDRKFLVNLKILADLKKEKIRNESIEQDKRLRRWIFTIRQGAKKQERTRTRIYPARLEALNLLNFPWKASREGPRDRMARKALRESQR